MFDCKQSTPKQIWQSQGPPSAPLAELCVQAYELCSPQSNRKFKYNIDHGIKVGFEG